MPLTDIKVRFAKPKQKITGYSIIEASIWRPALVEESIGAGNIVLAARKSALHSGYYNFAEHLPERRRMMQPWADYLDDLKDGVGNPVIAYRSITSVSG